MPGICQKKENNMSGVNLCQDFALTCSPSLSPKVITWLEPAIQWKTSTWSVVNFKKTINVNELLQSLSPQYAYVMLVSGYLDLTAVN